MAMEQHLTHTPFPSQPFQGNTEKPKSSPFESGANPSGGFDCSICLDTVQDPVVTLCGHLYCWPCIYKWIRQQSASPDQEPAMSSDNSAKCPVCKAKISEATLVPLYTGPEAKPKASDHLIPRRPKGLPCHPPTQQGTPHQQIYPPYGYDTSAPAISLAGTTTFQPVISMVGELICGDTRAVDAYPSSYSVAAMSSSRARRHAMRADQSLSRLSFFLFCCLVLCLLFF